MAKFVYSECNEKQKKAWKNIKYAYNDYIGGWENELLDSEEGSEERNHAKKILGNREALIEIIYKMAITDVYTAGGHFSGPQAERFLKDIRFCGKEWMQGLISAMLKHDGY